MVSEKSENFLMKLRVELLFRGKKEKEINEITEELRDHLYLSEKNGEDVNNITDTPIKEYADDFLGNMSLTKGLYKNLTYILIYVIAIIMIPRFFNFSFSITIGLLIYLFMIILVGLVLQLLLWKKLILRWGDSKKTYVLVSCYAIGVFILMILGEYLSKHYPIYELIHLNKMQSIISGLVLLMIFITACFILKHKLFALMLSLICLPDLIAIAFSSNNHDQYIIISSFLIMAGSWSVIGILIYRAWKSTREA